MAAAERIVDPPRHRAPAPAAEAEPGPGPARGDLPRWPVLVLLAGFPAWWALGATPIAPVLLAAAMAVLLLMGGRITILPGLLPWLFFVLWVLAAAVNVRGAGDLAGFGMRAGELVAVGVFMLYVGNAPRSLPKQRVVNYLVVMWVAIVLLGFLALLMPEVRLKTPVSMLVPDAVASNELVRNLVLPPLAEVQQPWGAPAPFIRPSAPFPYANSWGVAFVVLTPVVLSRVATLRRRGARALLLGLVALSFIPAVATSNRGMFLGLGVAVGYALLRFLGRGRWGLVALIGAVGLAAAAALVASGAVDRILGRQDYSDSTGGRLALYARTWELSLQSPLLGYGAPRLDPTIGVSLGTQGYVWMLLFCYGFVGLGLFGYFMVNGILRTRVVESTGDIWLHGVLLGGLAMIPFYSLSVIQMSVIGIVMSLLLRQRYRASDA